MLEKGLKPPEKPEPRCADCRESIELAAPDEPDSWIHAAEANYFGDHTAWFAEHD